MGKRSSALTIESVSAKHAGKYDCQVDNAAGSAMHSTNLKVIGVPFLLYINRNKL